MSALRSARPTLHDVAIAAGVSIKTASRALNDEPGVRTETAERVLTAAEQLGFRRNELARSLRASPTSNMVGVVLGDVGDPFWSGVVRGVEAGIGDREAFIMSSSTNDDPLQEQRIVRSMIERRVMALLLAPTSASQSYLRAELARGTLVACVDRPARGVDVDAVVAEDRDGARQAVTHMIQHGHRRIAYVGSKNVYTTRERLEGYRDALLAAGIEPDDRLVRVGLKTPGLAEKATLDLLRLDQPPTAFFTASIPGTFGLLRALRSTSSSNRRAIAFVAFSDFEAADFVMPGVTVVRNDPVALGRTAMELIWQRIDGYDGPARLVRLGTEFVVRGSGEVTP
jgi:LacI family transcriptional regulator